MNKNVKRIVAMVYNSTIDGYKLGTNIAWVK